MSYILDALKRAESERSRGAVPNIHALPDAAGDSEPPSGMAGKFAAALIGLSILALAAGAWWWFSRSEPAPWQPADAVGEVSVPALATPPIAPPLDPQLAAAPLKPPATVAAVPVTPARSQFSLPAARAPTVDKALSRSAASALAAAQPEARVYAIKELPEHIRNSLPALKVSGATYSESPANRMLIVNGNVFHEGDALTPEVSLQHIELRAAVLSFRGYRYSISY